MPNSFHHLSLRYFLKKEINEIYVMNALQSFATSMMAIFIPIFLLKRGFLLSHIAVFYIIWSIVAAFVCYLALKFISQFGIKHSLFLSIPFSLLYFFSLHQFGFLRSFLSDWWLLVVVGVLYAVSTAFYSMGFHMEFAKFSSREKETKQVGTINIISTVFSIFGPLAGALIITLYSFNTLFVVAAVILLLSIIPLLFSSEVHEPFSFSLDKLFTKKFKKGIPYIAEGFKNKASSIFWPVLLFVLAISINEIGGLYALSNTVLVLFTWFVSHRTTQSNQYLFLKIGAWSHSDTLIIRTFLKSVTSIVIIQSLGALSITLLQLPFSAIFYKNSKKKGYAYMIFFREFFLMIGRVSLLLIFLILLFFFSSKLALIIGIILGGLVTLFMPLLKEE